jgi:hypothetical protein
MHWLCQNEFCASILSVITQTTLDEAIAHTKGQRNRKGQKASAGYTERTIAEQQTKTRKQQQDLL